jgi:DNA-binding MarR family transcriptional regulator
MSMYCISVQKLSEPTVGFLVWRLSMKWRAEADRALAPLGLTQAQYSVLASLSGFSAAGRSPNQRELAEFVGLEPLYVSKLARALEKAGLVERPIDRADPRAVRLTLTDRGHEVMAAALPAVHAKHAELTAVIGGPDGVRNQALRGILLTLLDDLQIPIHSESEDQTVTEQRIFNGQDINVAAAATRAILDALLDREGVTFGQFVALRGLAGIGAPASRDAVAQGAAGPAADVATVRQAIDQLEAAGLVAAAEQDLVVPTESGQELFERVTTATVRAGDELFDGIAGQDLAVTKRVLDQITQRAQAVHARL